MFEIITYLGLLRDAKLNENYLRILEHNVGGQRKTLKSTY